MCAIGLYANINAKTRAMLSQLLDSQKWQSLFACSDIQSLMKKLEDTRYEKWTKNSTTEDFMHNIDLMAVTESSAAEKKIKYFLSGAPAEIMGILTEEYDIEQIKRGLRCWKKQTVFEKPAPEMLSGRHKINWDIFTNFHTPIEDLILSLPMNPFSSALGNARTAYKKTQSLFFLETALEKDLFRRIWLEINNLSGSDKRAVQKLFGLQTDILNIKNMIRCKLYYQLSPDMLEYVIYPNGEHLSFTKCFDSYADTGQKEFLGKIAVKPFDGLSAILKLPDIKPAMMLVDELLFDLFHKQIRNVLSGYPFTLGVPLAYVMLNRWELKQLRSLAWSIYLGADTEFKPYWANNPAVKR